MPASRLTTGAAFVALLGFGTAGHTAIVAYTADVMPTADGWSIANYPAYEAGHVSVSGGTLHLNDNGTATGQAIFYYKDFTVDELAPTVYAEWDVQMVFSDDASFFALERNVGGPYDVQIEIEASRVVEWGNHPTNQASATTTDGFHTYRAELDASSYRIYQDGDLLFGGAAGDSPPVTGDTIRIWFGSGSSAGTTEFYLSEIRYGPASSVPEPATALILGLGLLGGVRRARRSPTDTR